MRQPATPLKALIGLAATASVLTVGCAPLAAVSHTTTTKKPSTGGHLTFAAVADSFVYADAANRNAGRDTKLVSSSVAGAAKTAYVKFKVAGIASGSTVEAHLQLHRTDHHLPASLSIATASSNWSETAITDANAPAASRIVATPKPENAPTVLTVDVSSVVRTNGYVTFAIKDPVAGSNAIFYSREAGGKAPTLIVDYSGSKQTAVTAPTASPVAAPTTAPTTAPTAAPTPPGTGCSISSKLVSSCGIWWGAAAMPLAGESYDQALANFESTQGRYSDVLHYYHVGATTFPTKGELNRAGEGGRNRILSENWKPEQGRTWAQVAAGDPVVDAAIDHEANYLKSNYTAKFFLTIHHEPEDEVRPAAGSGYTASDYAAMYRHVVQRLRADGVTNAVFVMNYMGSAKWGNQSWFNALYPGDDVVDWIAEDPYSVGTAAPWRADFGGMVNRRDGGSWPGFYTWATTSHPGKPIMLAEWGVTENAKNAGSKASFYDSESDVARDYPAIKAILHWNAPDFPALDGATRIDSSTAALASFRRLAQNPLFNPPLP
jgi:hypothetical protein